MPFIQGVLLDSDDYLRSEIQKQFNNYIKQAVEIRDIQSKTKNLELENQRVRDRIYSVEKEQPQVRKDIADARKIANDGLYETREGRKIVEGKIEEASKIR